MTGLPEPAMPPRRPTLRMLVPALAVAWAAATHAGSPLSPDDARASFHLADPALRIECVAAEPLVSSPVALAWDARGRLFVAEMNDYPDAPAGGRIRLLVDRDGDGLPESSTPFADDLHFPASVHPWRDGLLVAAAPDILFLRDTDGDGRADERRVLFTGFGLGNQQLRVNSLTWSLDNWIYGANGRSDGELRGASLPAPLALRRRDFRFHPDTGAAEVLAGPSQFGLAFNAAGQRFLSWNTVPIRHEVLPRSHLGAIPDSIAAEVLQDCLEPGDRGRVYPLAPAPRTFNRESTSHFNALAGLHLYGGDALGPAYQGSAFLGETLRSLVHRRVLEPSGPTFVAHRPHSEQDREFLASTDPWFHPVNFATGPDGALYICDFYRRWVEHPGFVPPHLRNQVDWREGSDHGRIWRITAGPPSPPAPQPGAPPLPHTPREQVQRLVHPNAWQRLTAQRLLVENQDPAAVPALRRLARSRDAASAQGRIHALWTLDTLGALEPRLLASRFSDPDPHVRANALRIAAQGIPATHPASPPPPASARDAIRRALRSRGPDPDPAARLQQALLARDLPSPGREEFLASLLRLEPADPWIQRAALASASGNAREMALALLKNPPRNPDPVCLDLGRLLGSLPTPTPSLPPLGWLPQDAIATHQDHALLLVAGIAEGLLAAGRSPVGLLPNPESAPAPAAAAAALPRLARGRLDSESTPTPLRVRAFALLIDVASAAELPRFRDFLSPRHPAELQIAAAERLARRADPPLAADLLHDPSQYSAATRRRLLAVIGRNPAAAAALVQGLEEARIPRIEIDPPTRESLLQLQDPELRRRAGLALASASAPDRPALIQRYRPALETPGNASRGAEVFTRNCLPCHRIADRGGQVGPELTGIGSRSPEILLADILDPSRQVAPDYVAYTVATSDGESLTGLLVRESTTSLTLRRANVPDETVPRSRVAAIRPETRSLMPDGLEAGISPESMSDLLAFLADPTPDPLPR